MTVDKPSGHLMAAADSLNDARTELRRAARKSESAGQASVIGRANSTVNDMENLLRELSIQAEVTEMEDDDEH